ncbi:bifunctional riboflavin kinase/FAD synthetase [Alkalicoccus chagannorensis]|uniref:bifunctional riboflavin kinase/FAD synthetase n=1 Tax=Alkalicoccus chagannorensis TaxID=427072 RepID=UPI0004204FE8|nr:bifunctional riboflavin kinase/FAD synthetase [Alkalicoccus chagannorensis]
MKTLHLQHPVQQGGFDPSVCALGFFDGVHRGHQQVIQTAIDKARESGVHSAVMTFDPHPKEVLRGIDAGYITLLHEKEALCRDMGVDLFYVVRFDERFASLTPQQFVDQFILGLSITHVTAGFDYTFGQKGRGTMETFSFHSRGKVTSTTVDKFEEKGEKISSTAVRRALEEGNVPAAADALGRLHSVTGTVVEGEKRGRTIGFPTANVQVPRKKLLPADGVYAVKLMAEGKEYAAVANIGSKPTFHEDHPQTLEVHVFDFDQDLYGKAVTVSFIDWVRGEKKFDSLEGLKAQIQADAEKARTIAAD